MKKHSSHRLHQGVLTWWILAAWLAAPTAFSATLPLVWRWSNPLPHGANIVDQTSLSSFSVQVGECGQILTSEDWTQWWPRDSHTSRALRGATFLGGRLVVTGEGGTVVIADRPDQMYLLHLGTLDWLEGVAASPDLVVAVGDNAAVYTSTNAVVWQRVGGLPFTKWLRGVAYGGNVFVAVGEGGLIATSGNGMNWQVQESSTTVDLNRVAWLGDHFLAVGDDGMALASTSGGSWTKVAAGATNPLYGVAGLGDTELADGDLEVCLSENHGVWVDQLSPTLPSPAPEWTYYSALYKSNYFLLSGQTGMNVEGLRTNGIVQWQSPTPSVRTWLWSVTRTPSHYLAVGDHGVILSSPDGIDWDLELTPGAATNSVLLGVGGSSNLVLAVGTQGTVLWGTNVYLWNPLPPPTVNDLQGVCFDGLNFVLTGGNGTVLTSPNGIDWTPRPTPTSKFLMSLAATRSGLVAVGEGGTILTSSNSGTNWTLRSSGTTNWLSQVRWLNDRLVALGQNGTILTSFDGKEWRTAVSGTEPWLNAAEFLDGAWFAVGNQGAMLGSPDCTNWYNLGTLTKKSLYGLVAHAGKLVSVGTEGVVLRSQVVPELTPVNIAEFSRGSGTDVFLFGGNPDQRFALQSSKDLINWTDDFLLELLDSSGTLLWIVETEGNAAPTRFYRTRLLP